MHFVSILECGDGSHYVGCTNDLGDRLKRHNQGHVPATQKRIPIKLIAHLVFENKYKVYDFEKYLKSGSGRALMQKHLI